MSETTETVRAKADTTGSTVVIAGEKTAKDKKGAENEQLLSILKDLAASVGEVHASIGAIDKRLKRVETGDKDAFKNDAIDADVTSAAKTREKIDPKVQSIVNEILGTDFGIELKGREDTPGWMFTVIVPERLNDNVIEKRPVKDAATNDYLKDHLGLVVFEDYRPEDRRTRAISDADSYGAIREHCERIRNYIVAYYQTNNKPLPAFKVV